MSGWRWDREAAPAELARYVQQDLARKLLPSDLARDLPGTGGQAPAEKARLIFDVFARRVVRYVDEPSTSGVGRQTVRPVDQVLARPRQATCLDICVAYAGACLDAGVHPMIVVLDSRRGGPGHAIVVVWLDGSWSASPTGGYPLAGAVHESPPATGDGFALPGEVRMAVGGTGSFLAIDVTGATWRAGAPGPAKDWAGAVTGGAAMLTATGTEMGAWRWALGVDVGLARHTTPALDLADWRPPAFEPLVAAYTQPNPEAGPLTQIKARQGVVPFHARDELDLLLEWAQTPSSASGGVELAVVYGVGGAGKTHLAAELCRRLDSAGWYAGFLAKHPAPGETDLAWLSGVVSPVLVVVDYVEDTGADGVIAAVKALRGREEPTRVLMTARSMGHWLTSIITGTGRDGISSAEPLTLALPRRHPASAGVFRRAAQRFAQLPGMSATTVDKPPDNPRWTTLDLVLQAWLAATGLPGEALPTTRDPLYDKILEREFGYWLRTCLKRKLPEYPLDLFAQAGAVLTLLAPATRPRVTRALTAVEELAAPTPERAVLIDVLTGMLSPDSAADGFAIRPDPVGERLVLRELATAPDLMDRCVPPDPSQDERLITRPENPDAQADTDSIVEGFRACTVLTRAAEQDARAATELTRRLLDRHWYLWPAGFIVALNQGGPIATTLTELAQREDSPLPLAQLANEIPPGHASLRNLALIATQRSRPRPDPSATESGNLATVAAWWNNLAVRRGEVGDRAGALAAIGEAVSHYRQLAEANPAAFLPDLAASLNNQANRRGEVGDRAGALAAIDEAVSHYRQLAEANPAAFLPDLAMSLNNQANQRSGVGDRAGALAAIEEAVSLRRQLAEANPAAFLPDLAMSLNNQANQRSEVGDRNGALAAFVDCWTGFTPGPRAELMAERSRWRLRHTDPGRAADLDGAIDDLAAAATTAAEPDQPHRSGAARRAVRATAAHLVESSPITGEALSRRLPAWVTTDIPNPVMDILNRWLAARDWADREALIRATAAALLADNGQPGIALARFLYPEANDLTELNVLLEQIRSDGLEPVLAAHQNAHAHAADLRTWLATPTWEQSRTFLREHPGLVSDPRTWAVLESAEKDPMASQHLGILRLIQSNAAGSVDDVYDAVADPTVAADLAMTCLERLDTTTLDNLLHAAPNLVQTAFAGPYLLAARTALSAPEDTAQANPRPMIELAIRTGTATQRAAGATRLRRIAQRRPAAATALEEMAAQLDAANSSGTG